MIQMLMGIIFNGGRWDDGGQKAMIDGVKGATKTVTVGGANNPSGLSKTGPNAFFLMSSNPAAATSSTPPAAPYDVWWRDGTTTNTWTAATPAAVTSTNGCDPCRAATNNEWRLPTAAEWNQLMIDEGIIAAQGLATAHASNLKLVAAGYRNAYGNVISQGSTSAPIMFVATSSTTANHSKYGGGAAILNIRVTTATTATGFQRYYGVSVRCLKNVSL